MVSFLPHFSPKNQSFLSRNGREGIHGELDGILNLSAFPVKMTLSSVNWTVKSQICYYPVGKYTGLNSRAIKSWMARY